MSFLEGKIAQHDGDCPRECVTLAFGESLLSLPSPGHLQPPRSLIALSLYLSRKPILLEMPTPHPEFPFFIPHLSQCFLSCQPSSTCAAFLNPYKPSSKSSQFLQLLRTQPSIHWFFGNVYLAHQRSDKGPRDRDYICNIHCLNIHSLSFMHWSKATEARHSPELPKADESLEKDGWKVETMPAFEGRKGWNIVQL